MENRKSLMILTRKKKEIPEFVGDIQAKIDNVPSMLIRSIARILVCQILIRYIVHKDIHYSSYKMRKGRFVS